MALIALLVCPPVFGASEPECLQSGMWFLEFAPPRTPGLAPPPTAPRLALLDGLLDETAPDYRAMLASGYDFVDADADPYLGDLVAASAGDFHATAVASVLAAHGPWFRIAPYRVLDRGCAGDAAHVAAGIERAVSDGARVILLPFGDRSSDRRIRQAVQAAVANDVLIVAAAGNDGPHQITSLARTRLGVLAVAAVDAEGFPAEFSGTSPAVDLSDRGVDLVVAWAGGGRALASGTSFAAARTAAAAGVIRALRPELSAAEVIALLIDTASPGAAPGRNLGAGVTSLDAALARLGSPAAP